MLIRLTFLAAILMAVLGVSSGIAGDEVRPFEKRAIFKDGKRIYTEKRYRLPTRCVEIMENHKKELEQGGEPPPQEGVLGTERVQVFSAEQRFLFIRGPEEDHRKARELVRKLWLWSRQDQRNKK